MKQIVSLPLLVACILLVFLGRMLLAAHVNLPYTFQFFDMFTAAGMVFVISKQYSWLRWQDWLIALSVGMVVGIGMLFATLFSPYPLFGIIKTTSGQALLRGLITTIAILGGLIIMRQGGPVKFYTASADWRKAIQGVLVGFGLGLPMAFLNSFALQITQHTRFQWQNLFPAARDALQPSIVEEAIYRFALWGIFWLILRNSQFGGASWLSGILATLVHNYSHFDDLFLSSPMTALGMGTVLLILWGIPLWFLARRHGFEAAVAFHWLQDVARFLVITAPIFPLSLGIAFVLKGPF